MKNYFIEKNAKIVKDYTVLISAVREYNNMLATTDLENNLIRLWNRDGSICVENERISIEKDKKKKKGYL